MPHSLMLLVISLVSTFVSAQWVYPANLPADRVLTDYTSGKATPMEYIVHDGMIGQFKIPIALFSILRCAQEGRTEPINPSTESFNSTEGRLAPDGTWQKMEQYTDGFENLYWKGSHLWIVADFEDLVGNATTGQICWWELYDVTSRTVQTPFDPITGIAQTMPEVTLLGAEVQYYFPTTPFKVNTQMRPGNRNFTWGKNKSYDNGRASTTINVSNQPTGAANALKDIGKERSDGFYMLLSAVGMLLGLV